MIKESTRTVLISFGTSAASIFLVISMLQTRMKETEAKVEDNIKHTAQTDVDVAVLQANTLNMVQILNEVKNDVKAIRKDLQKRQ